MIDSQPYKIVWKKRYNAGEHVHYEQYMERENAEARMDELLRLHKVKAKIYYPDHSDVTRAQQLKQSCSSAQKSR